METKACELCLRYRPLGEFRVDGHIRNVCVRCREEAAAALQKRRATRSDLHKQAYIKKQGG